MYICTTQVSEPHSVEKTATKNTHFSNIIWTIGWATQLLYVSQRFKYGLRRVPDASPPSTWEIYLDETVFTSHTSFVAVAIETPCIYFETKWTSTGNVIANDVIGEAYGKWIFWSITLNHNGLYTRSQMSSFSVLNTLTILTSPYLTIKLLTPMAIKGFPLLNLEKLWFFRMENRTCSCFEVKATSPTYFGLGLMLNFSTFR